MMLRIPVLLQRLLILLLLVFPAVRGQSITGSITGTVKDTTGLAISGASVKLLQVGTGGERSTVTNDGGGFVFSSVTPGEYRIGVSHAGFKSVEKRGVRLSASDRLAAGEFVLEVGSLTDSVTVTSSSDAVQTLSGERSGVVSARQIESISVRGRNITDLLQLLPGVYGGSNSEGLTNNWSLVVQGQTNTSSVNLDGAYLNATNMGNGAVTVSMDSVAEVKVLMTNYQAEYGRVSGANIQLVSKSGTREFHGLASYFKRHEQFNANDFFRNQSGLPVALYRYNTFTYQIGGPVYIPKKFNKGKDKLFFFFTQEFWPKTTGTLKSSTVPTALERSGDFSKSVDTNDKLIVIRDPLSSAAFPGNIIPGTRLDQNGLALMKMFPLPNFLDRNISKGQYNFNWDDTLKTPTRTETGKVDFLLNPSNIVAFNYTHSRFGSEGVSVPASASVGWPQIQMNVVNDGKAYIGRYQRIFNPTLINELNMNYTDRPWYLVSLPDGELNRNLRSTVGFKSGQFFPEVNPVGVVPNATFGGVTGAASLGFEGRFPFNQTLKMMTISDNLSKNFTKHALKLGFYFDNTWTANGVAQAFNGAFAFGRNVNNPLDTNYTYSNAALGVFDTYSEASLRPIGHYSIPSPEWFVQDTWRVSRRFTLDYGLRFVITPPEVTDNYPTSGFDPSAFNPAKAQNLIQPGLQGKTRVGVNPVTGEILPAALIGSLTPNSGFYGNGMVSNAIDSNIPRSIATNRGVQSAPRIGFAWDATGDGKTAVRGGFGISYGRITSGISSNNITVQPPLAERPTVYYGALATFLTSGRYSSPSTVTGIDPNLKNPTTMNFSLSIQRGLWRGILLDTAYVGSLTRHGAYSTNLNYIPFGANFDPKNLDSTNNTVLPPAFLRRYQGYQDINYYRSNLTSNYHSLQTSVNRRVVKGLQFGGSWTWSKAMNYDGVSELVNPKVWNYGLVSSDRTHVLKVNFLYDLPAAPVQSSLVKAVLNNWQISGLTSMVSGVPLGIGFTTTTGADITGSPTNGARIVVTGNPILPKSERMFYRFFNTGVFQVPAKGTIGNAARTLIRGPGLNNWDLSLFKNFKIREKVNAQLRSEFYNAFNHTQFTGLDTTARFDAGGNQVNARFGQLTSAASPRIIQLALRCFF